ncbi:hypothetical protein EDM76_04300 [bacterium]|nr:MAG: hypothetical protein EDM76_04300 [bacterium]RIL03353.1 MAG: hypothetical protein DCC78_04810 [bacterium]
MSTISRMEKHVAHLGVRFYRAAGVELVLVPLVKEAAAFTRSAGDGFFLVALIGDPGAAYPLDLWSPATYDPEYLAKKFRLDRRGFAYTPEELAAALTEVAADLRSEEAMDE